jgi:hypothetical protein
MNALDYLQDSEVAVRHMFDEINSYDSFKLPSIMKYIDKTGIVTMTKEENDAFLDSYKKYFDLDFSRATMAGSLLQVAYNCLNQFSPGPDDHAICEKFNINKGSIAERLCIGRKVHGIPIGLLIYAGRVQYNHWEDGKFNGITQDIFRELVIAHMDDIDMVYELNYPAPRPVSHYIIRVDLKWQTYDDYFKDIYSSLRL